MKKILLLALVLSAGLHAVTMPSSQAKVEVDPVTSIGSWKTASGSSGSFVSFTAASASIGSAGNVSLTTGSAYIGQVGASVSLTAATVGLYIPISTTTALTPSAGVYLTTTAVSCWLFDNTYGAVTVNLRVTTSGTVPTDFATQKGISLIPGAQLNLNVANGSLVPGENWLWYLNPGTVTVTAKVSR